MMPQQKPGSSKQDYATPPEFIRAVQRRLGITKFACDFAADASNAKAYNYFTEVDNALHVEFWSYYLGCTASTPNGVADRWGWLNPPYSDIGPWAKKCFETKQHYGGQVAFLVPASVGSNWYRDFVHNKALVLALNGRLAFIPEKPKEMYPKDLILCLYSPRVAPGFDVWNWRAE